MSLTKPKRPPKDRLRDIAESFSDLADETADGEHDLNTESVNTLVETLDEMSIVSQRIALLYGGDDDE